MLLFKILLDINSKQKSETALEAHLAAYFVNKNVISALINLCIEELMHILECSCIDWSVHV